MVPRTESIKFNIKVSSRMGLWAEMFMNIF